MRALLLLFISVFLTNCSLEAEDGIRDQRLSRGLGDVYKRQLFVEIIIPHYCYHEV